jgi:hypothetical protein
MRFAILVTLCTIAPVAWGCATCFGDADSSQTQGMNAGIIALLAVTGTVLGTMAVVTGAILLRMRRINTEQPTVNRESATSMEADLT